MSEPNKMIINITTSSCSTLYCCPSRSAFAEGNDNFIKFPKNYFIDWLSLQCYA